LRQSGSRRKSAALTSPARAGASPAARPTGLNMPDWPTNTARQSGREPQPCIQSHSTSRSRRTVRVELLVETRDDMRVPASNWRAGLFACDFTAGFELCASAAHRAVPPVPQQDEVRARGRARVAAAGSQAGTLCCFARRLALRVGKADARTGDRTVSPAPGQALRASTRRGPVPLRSSGSRHPL
jgi:hypothetical protein